MGDVLIPRSAGLPSVSKASHKETPRWRSGWQLFLSFRGTTCRGIPGRHRGLPLQGVPYIGKTRWNGTSPLQWMILWMWLWHSLLVRG